MKQVIVLFIALNWLFLACNVDKSEPPILRIPKPKIKFSFTHHPPGGNTCSAPKGICAIIRFLEGDPVYSGESVAEVEAATNTLILSPDQQIWDSNGDVPVSVNQYLPAGTISDLGLPSGSYVVAGTYTVTNPYSQQPTVTVSYAY